MSYPERMACLGGGILLALAATLVFRGNTFGNPRSGRRRGASELPVEELAEKLKEAWSEHHTTA